MAERDPLTIGALLVGGGLAGYAASRWLHAREDGQTNATPPPPALPPPAQARPSPTPTRPTSSRPVPDGPVSSPSEVDVGPVTSPSQVEPTPTLSREFDPIFERYRDAIPIEYLRALSQRESGMNPLEQSGPAWGLMQIIEVVRRDYNEAHGTRYTREQLLEPEVSVAMACWLLRFIIGRFARKHSDIPNLRADWDNPRFVELLTYSWNAGFSEAGGVGRVATYLKTRGIIDLTIDVVHKHARAAGASRHLSNAAKVKWCKSVARLYERERTQSSTSRR